MASPTNHPDDVSELTAAISRWQMKNDASDYELAKRLGCSPNTPLGWRAGRSIDLTPERAEAIAELLGTSIEEVLVMRGFRLGEDGGATVGGPSPRSPQSQIDATSKVVSIHGRKRDAEIYPITGRQLDLPEAAGL